MAEQRVKKSPPISQGKPHLSGQYLKLWSGELARLGPQHADWIDLFYPKKHLVHSGRRGLQARRNFERDVFGSWLHVFISNVWTSLFLLEVALPGKVQAMPFPPVPKQKVCDEEKLLQVKCSWDPSCPALP